MIDTVEERLARRLVERFSLKPPIPVDEIARRYADVESVPFPVDVDGVSLYLKALDRRPEILINSSQPRTRWRFTLAHELGHVVIPWHIGSIVDDTDLVSRREKSSYRIHEGEANRFAAELLMPSDWARERIGHPKDMAERVVRLADEAEVSVDAATLKVLRVGPPGYIVAKTQEGVVEWAGRTDGTKSNRPPAGCEVSEETVAPRRHYGTVRAYGATYHWWREAKTTAIPPEPSQEWREILAEILAELPLADIRRAQQSINGILAVANGSLREDRSRDSIYAACLHNVRNRADANPDIAKILAHPRFHEFLVARAYAFNV